jgi:hypothetical protein
LPADALTGATLVTASALLDVLSTVELTALVEAVATVRCPALLTLSVVGSVQLDPPDCRDQRVAAAFDAHQQRPLSDGRRLLGRDAVPAAVDALTRRGARVEVRDSPWHLGRRDAALLTAWLGGWVGAACEQDGALPGPQYLATRQAQVDAGALRVSVGHADLLAWWQ